MKDHLHTISALQLLLETPGDQIAYNDPDRSFSPHYSNIGLTFDDLGGIASIELHYNRRTQSIAPAMSSAKPSAPDASLTHIQSGDMKIAFFEQDAFVVEGRERLTLDFLSNKNLRVITDKTDENRFLRVMHKTKDPRDPDVEFPMLIGIRVLSGDWEGNSIVGLEPAYACVFQFLVLDEDLASAKLAMARDVNSARQSTEDWMSTALGDLSIAPQTENEKTVLSRAVPTLLMNSVRAPGMLKDRIASFPSRGGYPTHFLWDACFHMLALEEMSDEICRDALMLLVDNMRADGLAPHFICSTWIRPVASQPALIGWAAERFINRTGNTELAEYILPHLEANCDWWLTHRLNRFGLITCYDPFETGWDDTPRLDHGPIVATDMSAYVLMQMRTVSRLATLNGKQEKAKRWSEKADSFAQKLVDVCWSEETGRLHDVLLEDGSKMDILSPAPFLPFLGSLPLSEKKQKAAVEKYLFDENRLFGEIPFPCVAYDDPSYDQKQMWRGPMWPPISWLLLELLDQLCMADIKRNTALKLYEIILEDGHLYEYFDSQTGKGLGYPQQGWTAALFLRLHVDLIAEQNQEA